MAEYSTFFDSTEDDPRIYQSADWAEYMRQVMGGLQERDVIGTGVSRYEYEYENNLMVSVPGNNMTCVLGAGAAFIDGRFYKNDSALSLAHSVADPSNDRIDIIVLRLDLSLYARNIRAYVKQGAPASNPVAPSPVWHDTIKEIQLATVRIAAGTSFIASGSVTDTRADETVCGYLPLHNIYRGMKIDNRGIVSFPNNSYAEIDAVDAMLGDGIAIPDRETVALPLGSHGVLKDTQNEIHGTQFMPKNSGTYIIFAYVRFDEVLLPDSDVQISLRINDAYSSILYAASAGNTKNNIFSGNIFEQIAAGDAMGISVYVANAPTGLKMRNYRIRIAKIN